MSDTTKNVTDPYALQGELVPNSVLALDEPALPESPPAETPSVFYGTFWVAESYVVGGPF